MTRSQSVAASHQYTHRKPDRAAILAHLRQCYGTVTCVTRVGTAIFSHLVGDAMYFNDHFNPDRDLLYGLSEDIAKYTSAFVAHWKDVPGLNDAEKATRRKKRLDAMSMKPAAATFTNTLLYTVSSDDELVKEYYAQALTKYPRFKDLDKNKQLTTACKFLLIFAGTMKLKIYFLLDNLNTDVIAAKSGVNSDSITAIELRNIYRNRGEDWARDHVIFILDGIKVEAPWVTKVELWAKYSKRRVEKMIVQMDDAVTRLEKSGHGNASSSDGSASSASSTSLADLRHYTQAYREIIDSYRGLTETRASEDEELVALHLMAIREMLHNKGMLELSKASNKVHLHTLKEQ